jgi:ATP-dependent helicase/nuclease subunit A
MQLTSSQQAALALDKNISVTAGAGSGKTRILVDRFLAIAFNNPSLTRHIVAITFTEKAAAEMQERIAQEVNNRLQKENLNSADRKKLQSIRDQLSSANISTIHGFCMRILQEFPVEANVTSDFAILDPLRQQVMIQKAIAASFENLNKQDLQDSKLDWFSLFTALSRFRIADMLKTSLEKPFEMQIISREFKKRTRQEYMEYLTKEWTAIFKKLVSDNELQQIFNKVFQILQKDTLTHKEDNATVLQNHLKSFAVLFTEQPSSVKTHGEFLRLCDAFTKADGGAFSGIRYLGKKENWSPAVHNEVVFLSEILSPVKLRLKQSDPGFPPDETDEKWYDLFVVFLDLYEQTHKIFRQIKEEQGVLDFEDLQLETLNLLQQNENTRQKLHTRFRYIMVDEFQDTNPVQWQIVELLAMENRKISKDQLFIVGDPKQSIYGFRDADIRIFKNIVHTFAQNAGHMFGDSYEGNLFFKESFRFLPGLNSFINHFFSQILQTDSDNPYEVHFENLDAQRDLPQTGYMELAVLDEDNPEQSEAEYMALKINELMKNQSPVYEWADGKELARPMRFGDIAILIRDRAALSDIEFNLRNRDIPFKTVGGIGFWQRQEIYDIYHILRFLANPSDDLALIAILRSRLILLPDSLIFLLAESKGIGYLEKLQQLRDDERLTGQEKMLVEYSFSLIDKWLKLRERLTLSEMFNIILEDTKLFALLNAEFNGEQRTANLQKVIELADSFDQAGPGGMRAFLDIIDDLINREVAEGEAFLALDDRDSVKIMTVHVSKGLQFPVVFAPFLNRSVRNVGSDIMLDRELGMAVTFKNEDEGSDSSNENTLYRLLRIRQKQKDVAEEKRIFYVAVSRACDYLFLSASAKDQRARSNSKFSWFNDCLIREGKSAFFPGMISFEKFQLNVVNAYENVNNPAESVHFNRFLEDLRKEETGTGPGKLAEVVKPLSATPYGRIFSATAIMTFARDPEEYYRHYHLGFFEQDYKQNIITKTDDIDSLLKGKIFHRFLEIFKNDPQNPSATVEKILFDFEIFDAKIRDQISEELISVYKTMQTSEHGQKILNATEYQNEISLTMQLGDDFLTGTIDRLQKNEKGEWEVYDYKTNRITADQVEITGKEYEIQLKSYALLLSHLSPNQNSYTISFYFLSVDNVYLRSFSQQEINTVRDDFLKILDNIKQAFPLNQAKFGRT